MGPAPSADSTGTAAAGEEVDEYDDEDDCGYTREDIHGQVG